MDNQNNKQEPKISAPPSPQARIRTMESDIKAVQQGGGEALWTEAGQELRIAPKDGEKSPQEQPAKIDELIFTPTSIISSHQPSPGRAEEISFPEKSPKKIILTAFIVGGVVILGFFLGYKFIYPLMAPKQESPTQTIAPSFPSVSTTSHQSLFIVSPDKTERIRLATVSLSAIKNSLSDLSGDGSPVNTFKEVVFLTAQKSADFSVFIKEILPDFSLKTDDFFEEDFTAFLYYDEKGAWPGYAAKLKPSVIIINAQTQVKQIEQSAYLKNFFIQTVGPANVQGFENGEANGKPIRYLTFPRSGDVFSYGWFTDFVDSKAVNYLVISASERGLEEAVKRLVK